MIIKEAERLFYVDCSFQLFIILYLLEDLGKYCLQNDEKLLQVNGSNDVSFSVRKRMENEFKKT